MKRKRDIFRFKITFSQPSKQSFFVIKLLYDYFPKKLLILSLFSKGNYKILVFSINIDK